MPDSLRVTRRQALRISAAVGTGAAFGIGLGREVLRKAALRRVSETRTRMGTVVTLTVVHPDGAAARAMVAEGFMEMERLEGVFSRYRVDSALGRLNATGLLNDPPSELVEVLTLAAELSDRSEGAFDVTIAPLVELYAASFEAGERPPSDGDIARVLDHVGHQGLRVEGGVVSLATDGMQVTLDGIAKGYIVDRVVDGFSAAGADRVLVDAGGDMSSGGEGVDEDPWTVGVQHPRQADDLIGLVQLAGGSIATSGDYLRHFTPDRRHHDIIDPRTGRSPEGVSSSTVLAASAAMADALSTAALVLGTTEGVRLVEAVPGADCLLVGKDGQRALSSGMPLRLG